MTVGSLFSGVGGLDLGFERAGFEILWFCEKDDYCKKILNKHWPDVPVYDDVRTLYTDEVPETPDILIGGFPCQDISWAGNGEGIEGDRSGLWFEFHRIIRVCRPRYVVAENVPALTHRGLDAVLCSLAEVGYDAEWTTLKASSFGAPHKRSRLFLVSYPHCNRLETHTHEEILRGQAAQRLARHTSTMGSAKKWTETCPIGARPMGVGNGPSDEVDRLRALGNAVVPQVAEYVARSIRAHAEQTD